MKLKFVEIEFTCSLDDILVPGFLNKEFNNILSCPAICSEDDAERMIKFYNLDSDFWKEITHIKAKFKDGEGMFLLENNDGEIILKLEHTE